MIHDMIHESMNIHSPERGEGKGFRAQVSSSTGQDVEIERLEGAREYKPVLG